MTLLTDVDVSNGEVPDGRGRVDIARVGKQQAAAKASFGRGAWCVECGLGDAVVSEQLETSAMLGRPDVMASIPYLPVKMKEITSITDAFTVGGSKKNPFSPTWTCNVRTLFST